MSGICEAGKTNPCLTCQTDRNLCSKQCLVKDLDVMEGAEKMDKLDIFEMDSDTRIITTIRELQRLYCVGAIDGERAIGQRMMTPS